MSQAKPPAPPSRLQRLRRVVPFAGAGLLLAYFAWTADLSAAAAAVGQADIALVVAVLLLGTGVTWIFDSLCLVWLIEVTLGGRGRPGGAGLREMAPLKAASYVLNIINYNAATLGMAWVVSRRKAVGFIESAAALAVLSYLDLVALAGLVVAGLIVAPETFAGHADIQQAMTWTAASIFAVAVVLLLLLQSRLSLGPLERLRSLSIVRPLAALSPSRMLVGVALRAAFVMCYVVIHYWMMRAFGMSPTWGSLLVIVPVLTVVGVVPISVSGIGTTQVLARTLYAAFVTDGRPADPVIDAWSTLTIFGFILVRVLLALPFLSRIQDEVRTRPTDTGSASDVAQSATETVGGRPDAAGPEAPTR